MLESKKSLSLIEIIREKIIAAGGKISFSEFMALALYHPELGYYLQTKPKFGKTGDFITAPLLSPLFAKCVAHSAFPIFEKGLTEFLEIGAGSGHFASDFLKECKAKDCLPSHYYIYEISPALRELQKETLEKNAPDLFSKVTWLDSLTKPINGVIFANEVLDALPVHCFSVQKNGIKEKCVTSIDNHLQWELADPSPELKLQTDYLQKKYDLKENYESELCLEIKPWLAKLSAILAQGVIFLFDYGYAGKEFYHVDRKAGTLLCYSEHAFHDNPFVKIGEQDITAHVDFTHVAEAANELGLQVSGFTTQAGFLLGAGLLHLLTNDASLEAIREKQAIKRLIFPSEMGEAIKAMALTKNYATPLEPFLYQDRRQDL